MSLFCETTGGAKIDKVVGIDVRGFIFGAVVADRLGAGFVPIRKKGKLPWKTRQNAYSLEYGEAIAELHEDAVHPGERVLLAGGLLAAAASIALLEGLEADIVAVTVVIELGFLCGRSKLLPHQFHAILDF